MVRALGNQHRPCPPQAVAGVEAGRRRSSQGVAGVVEGLQHSLQVVVGVEVMGGMVECLHHSQDARPHRALKPKQMKTGLPQSSDASPPSLRLSPSNQPMQPHQLPTLVLAVLLEPDMLLLLLLLRLELGILLRR